jgi:hypothetical protein
MSHYPPEADGVGLLQFFLVTFAMLGIFGAMMIEHKEACDAETPPSGSDFCHPPDHGVLAWFTFPLIISAFIWFVRRLPNSKGERP